MKRALRLKQPKKRSKRRVGRPKRTITKREREIYLELRRAGHSEDRAIYLSGVGKPLWQHLRQSDDLFRMECENIKVRSPNVAQLNPNESREQWLQRMEMKIRARYEGAMDAERGIAFVQIARNLEEQMKKTVMPGEVHEIKLIEIENRDGKIIEMQSA